MRIRTLLQNAAVALAAAGAAFFALQGMTRAAGPAWAQEKAEPDAPAEVRSAGGALFSVATRQTGFEAGDVPVFLLTVRNPHATDAVALTLNAVCRESPAVDPFSRAMPMPKEVWSEEMTVTLDPGEKRTLALEPGEALAAGEIQTLSVGESGAAGQDSPTAHVLAAAPPPEPGQ